MMPVDSTRSAATQATSGSYSWAWAGSISFAGTPLASARAASACSPGSSASLVATTSLPHTWTGTPCSRANATIDRLPATDMRALNEPGA
jgi:hypothetical protein